MSKPTIAELEAILEEKDVKIEILPNGETHVIDSRAAHIAELEARAEAAAKENARARDEWAERSYEYISKIEAAEADAARLLEILRDVWNQFVIERPDGGKWAGGLSTLADIEAALRHDG